MLTVSSQELSLFEGLKNELIQRKADGLLRQRRLLDSPQAEHIIANDKHFYRSAVMTI